MSISSLVRVVGAAALLSTVSTSALAGASDALAGCKAAIAEDSRMSQYEKVQQSTDKIRTRGRYTSFVIDVNAKAADGAVTEYSASCKASGSGKVKELELVQVGTGADAQVAQTK